MIKEIRILVEKEKKKISKKALEEIKKKNYLYIKDLIKRASRNSSFYGRKVIKAEDIE